MPFNFKLVDYTFRVCRYEFDECVLPRVDLTDIMDMFELRLARLDLPFKESIDKDLLSIAIYYSQNK